MRIFFDDNHKVLGVFTDDNANYPYLPANQIYAPFIITDKLSKTVSVIKQEQDESGHALFNTPDGDVVNFDNILGVQNVPIMDTVAVTRSVGLLESPGEWSLQDVLNSKYTHLANGAQFWFDEFFDTSSVNFNNSQINTGVNGISIQPGGVLQLNQLTLANSVNHLSVYMEVGDARVQSGLDVSVSLNGGSTFESLGPGNLSGSSQNFVFRITPSSPNVIAIPLHCFAVFY
jgi:hypothetical protein